MGAAVYLDHQATHPVDPRVADAMEPFLRAKFGHPASRSHAYGWEAERAVEAARAQVADLVRAEPTEVVFTSGSAESDNLAVKGVAEAAEARGRHVVTTAIENRPVLDSCAWLATKRGFTVAWVGCDGAGRVPAADVAAALRDDTVLASVHAANHEVGTLQPIDEVATACAARGVPLHVDASQAVAWTDVDLSRTPIAVLTFSADLLHGPKGAGAVVVRRRRPRLRLAAQTHGGAHERGLRAGTLDVAAVVGFGVAAALTRAERVRDVERVRGLRDRLEARLRAGEPSMEVHGDAAGRLASSLHVAFPGIEAEALLMGCPDVAASTGAGCTSADLEPSHVLRAMGLPRARWHECVRLSLGRTTTEADVDRAAARLLDAVARVRTLSAPRA